MLSQAYVVLNWLCFKKKNCFFSLIEIKFLSSKNISFIKSIALGTNKGHCKHNVSWTPYFLFDRCLCGISLCKNKGRETFVQISPLGVVGESNKFLYSTHLQIQLHTHTHTQYAQINTIIHKHIGHECLHCQDEAEEVDILPFCWFVKYSKRIHFTTLFWKWCSLNGIGPLVEFCVA